MMGKASREEREEVESWAGGSAERKRFVEDARGFYAGEEIPDGEIEQRMRRIWQTMPVSIWRRRMIFRWAAAVACVLLAVGIGWSVWLPGTREGRMMRMGRNRGYRLCSCCCPMVAGMNSGPVGCPVRFPDSVWIRGE